MNHQIRYFGQDEYSRILDLKNARSRGLSQTECERILIDAGASYEQAKNGSYVYLHHGDHLKAINRTNQDEYDQILDNFNAPKKRSIECIRHLESMGFSYGQAKRQCISIVQTETLLGKDTNESITSALRETAKSRRASCRTLFSFQKT